MPKWKYQKEKIKSPYDTYLRFEDNEEKTVRIKFWKFEKSQINDSLFNCTVIQENGASADKIWSVWNVDLRDELKKKLKTMNSNKTIVEITLFKKVEDEEESFTLKELKKIIE